MVIATTCEIGRSRTDSCHLDTGAWAAPWLGPESRALPYFEDCVAVSQIADGTALSIPSKSIQDIQVYQQLRHGPTTWVEGNYSISSPLCRLTFINLWGKSSCYGSRTRKPADEVSLCRGTPAICLVGLGTLVSRSRAPADGNSETSGGRRSGNSRYAVYRRELTAIHNTSPSSRRLPSVVYYTSRKAAHAKNGV